MKRLTLPVNVDDRPLAQLDVPEEELVRRYGDGVTPIIEPFTYPGPIRVWAIMLDDGQVVLLERDLTEGFTLLHANPPDLQRALTGLALPAECVTWRPQIGSGSANLK